jgi:hypothetical protein
MIFDNLADAALAIHDMSMNAEKEKAIFGRLSKIMIIPAIEWCEDELENRGAEAQDIMSALIQANTNVLFTILSHLTKPDADMKEVVALVRKIVLIDFDNKAVEFIKSERGEKG